MFLRSYHGDKHASSTLCFSWGRDFFEPSGRIDRMCLSATVNWIPDEVAYGEIYLETIERTPYIYAEFRKWNFTYWSFLCDDLYDWWGRLFHGAHGGGTFP